MELCRAWPQAQKEAEKRVLAEARREKAALLKRAASEQERNKAKAAEAAGAEPAARAANGRSAAATGKGGGRLRVRTPTTPELDGDQHSEDALQSDLLWSQLCECLPESRTVGPSPRRQRVLFPAQATAMTMRSRARRTTCPSARASGKR